MVNGQTAILPFDEASLGNKAVQRTVTSTSENNVKGIMLKEEANSKSRAHTVLLT